MSYIPDQGDIVFIDFDPSVGREIQKRRPALVMSKRMVNQQSRFAFVCPITSTRRGNNSEVDIQGVRIQGVALSLQLKSMDFHRRNIEFVEKASDEAVEQMSLLLQALVKV